MGLKTIIEDKELASIQALRNPRSKLGKCAKNVHKFTKSLGARYGTDGSALIDDDEEMTTVLKSFSLEAFGMLEAPSEQDLVFLRYVADQPELESHNIGCVFGCSLHAVIDTWSAYLERIDAVRCLAEMFDTDRSGKIEAPELPALMKAIHGKAVPQKVVQWVFEQADITGYGALSVMEVARAISCYYLWLGKPDPIGDVRRLKCCIEVPDQLPVPPGPSLLHHLLTSHALAKFKPKLRPSWALLIARRF